MGVRKYIFWGTTEAYYGLCNHHPFTKIELISFHGLKMDILKKDNVSIILQIGRPGISFNENVNELLLLRLVLSNFTQPVLLTSFLARESCTNESDLFRYFPYLRLPYTLDKVLSPSVGLNSSIVIKHLQKTNFRDTYLKHEVENDTLPETSYKIFDLNLKAIKNESRKI